MSNKSLYFVFGFLTTCFLLLFFWISCKSCNSDARYNKTDWHIGDTVHVREKCYGVYDVAYFDRMVDAVNSQDLTSIMSMSKKNQLYPIFPTVDLVVCEFGEGRVLVDFNPALSKFGDYGTRVWVEQGAVLGKFETALPDSLSAGGMDVDEALEVLCH